MTQSRAAALVAALALLAASSAQGQPDGGRQGIAPVRSVTTTYSRIVISPARGPSTSAVTGALVMDVQVKPRTRPTNRWVLVVDNSHSMRGVFGLAMSGYQEITRYPTDDLRFCLYSFSNKGEEKFHAWEWASPVAFEEARSWLRKNGGTYSHGAGAIEKALMLKEDMLTVFIVSDGGFTSACASPPDFSTVRLAIKRGQAWRGKHKLRQAVIVTIGIENKNYSLAHKPPDADCQAFLRGVGRTGGGGYYLIRKAPRAAAKRAGPRRRVLR